MSFSPNPSWGHEEILKLVLMHSWPTNCFRGWRNCRLLSPCLSLIRKLCKRKSCKKNPACFTKSGNTRVCTCRQAMGTALKPFKPFYDKGLEIVVPQIRISLRMLTALAVSVCMSLRSANREDRLNIWSCVHWQIQFQCKEIMIYDLACIHESEKEILCLDHACKLYSSSTVEYQCYVLPLLLLLKWLSALLTYTTSVCSIWLSDKVDIFPQFIFAYI